MTTSKSPAAAAIRSSIRRALSQRRPAAGLTDLQAAVNDATAALDRLERAVKVRPGAQRDPHAVPPSWIQLRALT